MEFPSQLLYPIDQALLAVMIFVIMFGMGSSLTLNDFKAIAKSPRGVLIGFVSQFGLMPLIAFGLSHVLGLAPAFAISLILIGTLPGGTTSNMFTYFSRGSMLVILYLIFTAFFRHGALFLQTPANVYLAAIGLGLAGFLFGYYLSKLMGMYPVHQRAISLETGIQNGPVAFAVILLSFNEPVQSQMLWLAILYSTFIVISSSVVTLYFRRKGAFDWSIYKNTLVHNRLFGATYQTRYPKEFLPGELQRDPSQGSNSSQQR